MKHSVAYLPLQIPKHSFTAGFVLFLRKRKVCGFREMLLFNVYARIQIWFTCRVLSHYDISIDQQDWWQEKLNINGILLQNKRQFENAPNVKLKSFRYVNLPYDNDILGHIILSHGLQSRAYTCLLQKKCWSNFCDADIFQLIFSPHFDRNQILLCKYFDGKSLANSHNSINSIGFLKCSKFHEN